MLSSACGGCAGCFHLLCFMHLLLCYYTVVTMKSIPEQEVKRETQKAKGNNKSLKCKIQFYLRTVIFFIVTERKCEFIIGTFSKVASLPGEQKGHSLTHTVKHALL